VSESLLISASPQTQRDTKKKKKWAYLSAISSCRKNLPHVFVLCKPECGCNLQMESELNPCSLMCL
jgi:hypothetical protein